MCQPSSGGTAFLRRREHLGERSPLTQQSVLRLQSGPSGRLIRFPVSAAARSAYLHAGSAAPGRCASVIATAHATHPPGGIPDRRSQATED